MQSSAAVDFFNLTRMTRTPIIFLLKQGVVQASKIWMGAHSNSAADNLAKAVSELALRRGTPITVLRIVTTTLESSDSKSPIRHLMMHEQVAELVPVRIQEFRARPESAGEPEKVLQRELKRELERELISKADVICTTCSSSYDRRLKGMYFKHVSLTFLCKFPSPYPRLRPCGSKT